MKKKTEFLTEPKLPTFLPHGWKTEVANILGVHPITVARSIKRGKGDMYRRIVKIAASKYGEKNTIK